jgi:ribokinase
MTATDERDRFDVVVVGSINMDFVASAERLPARGETVHGSAFRSSPGGKGANQAVAASRLGARTAMLGCVGSDAIGQTLLAALRAGAVDCRAVRAVADSPSGVALIVVDASGANAIVVVAGANGRVTNDDIAAHEAMLAHARVVVLQLEIPMAVTSSAAAAARRLGRTVLLNPAPAQPLPTELLRSIDLLLPNETEASQLSGIAVTSLASARDAALALQRQGPSHVLVTLGAEGVVAATPDGVTHHRAIDVRPVDTTAAGDTFIGGLACGLAQELPLADAIALGQAAAAISVTRWGAQESIPRRGEVRPIR